MGRAAGSRREVPPVPRLSVRHRGRLAPGDCQLAVTGQSQRPQGRANCSPEAGAVDEDQGRYTSRLGERYPQGDEAAEGVADERRSPYVQSVDERGYEPLEEGGRVIAAGLALFGEPGRSGA